MPKLTRQNQKIFAKSSGANGIAVMGTMKTGTPVYSTDLATIQSTAYENGWDDAILNDKAPYLEEMNGVQYGFSYQTAYLLQEGIPEYLSTQTYYIGSLVKTVDADGDVLIYQSKADDNTGNSLDDYTYWKRITLQERAIGQTLFSLLPLTDSGLHLLDGALLSGSGIYGDFVSYIGDLYSSHAADNCFTTEGNWQNAVNSNGVCGKFVYDAVNNTVRLPKVTGIIEGTLDVSELGNMVDASVPQHGHTTVVNMGEAGEHTHTLKGTNIPVQSQNYTQVFHIRSDKSEITTRAAGTHTHPLTVSVGDANNAIYTGNKVQPQTIKGYYYIVVATAKNTDIVIDIDDVASDLNGKADVDLSNLSLTGRATGANLSFPSGAATNLSLGVSGSSYTATANGWFVINKKSTASGQYLLINNIGGKNVASSYAVDNDNNICLFMPAQKGDTVSIDYTLGGTTALFCFVVANGG